MKKNAAYTLIELLIVIGILSVVAATTIPTYMNYSQERNIDRVVIAAVNDIKLVRNKSLSGALQTSGSISSQYWTFLADCNGGTPADRRSYRMTYRNDTSVNTSGSDVVQKSLPTNYAFSSDQSGGNCGSDVDISFERLTGNLRGANLQTIYITGNNTWRKIDIYKSGNITISRP